MDSLQLLYSDHKFIMVFWQQIPEIFCQKVYSKALANRMVQSLANASEYYYAIIKHFYAP